MTSQADTRAYLASELRRHRRESGVTGVELAELLGVSQSKISKLETERLTPSPDDVEAIALALKLPAKLRNELVDQAISLTTDVSRWQTASRRGFHRKQEELQRLEAATKKLLVFNPHAIPGLLQSAEYARTMLARHFDNSKELGTAVTARLNRQQALYDPKKKFSFIIGEPALHWFVGDKAVMRAQLGHLLTLATLESVNLLVLPLSAKLPSPPHNAFNVLDDRLVLVETFTSELALRDADEIDQYRLLFKDFESVCLKEIEAHSVIQSLLKRSKQ